MEGDPGTGDVPVATAKAELRARVLAARRAMPPPDRAVAAAALTAAVLTLPEVRPARTIASYLSIGSEPSTAELMDVLRSRDVRVLVPVLRADLDLDWAIYETRAGLSPGDRGLWKPSGASLGVAAVAQADVLVVPALAVDAAGTRLGRGGGSYDRALTRLPRGRPVVALLYDGELLPAVPAEPHDRAVTVVVTPSGVTRPGAARPGVGPPDATLRQGSRPAGDGR
ncbi:MAG TPA: 5-formyltetrahydrofolate cyclo-ligase [Actinomycetes bacterium]|jgi:5-formyltetrahydrofolate cyclo-ligase|nr:5-formyltetrahydrofolate cyclo-ligase [Actinomycetes bacterium]